MSAGEGSSTPLPQTCRQEQRTLTPPTPTCTTRGIHRRSRGFELENVLPAGLGSKDQLVGDQTTQACWGEYLRARWDYWGPEVWISSHQTPLVVAQAWEASSHLFTTQAGFSPSQQHSKPGGPWDGSAHRSHECHVCAAPARARARSPACAVIGRAFSGSAAGASCATVADWDCFRLLTNSSC